MITRAATAGLLLAVSLVGCDLRRGAVFLHDTESWDYRAECGPERCESEIQSPHPARPTPACGPGARPGFALAGRSVIVACHACIAPGAAPRPDLLTCRALTCSADGDCPPHHRGGRVHCLHGLCRADREPVLDLPAAAGLCMAGAGPSGSARLDHPTDRLALARAACDAQGQCRAPAGCRVP